MKRYLFGGPVAALGAAVACGGGGNVTTPEPPPAPVASVGVSPDTAVLRLGVVPTLELTAVLRDASGDTLTGRAVSWSGSARAVVDVSPTGVLTAVDSGVATITATAEGRSGTAFAVVAPADATALCNDTSFSRSQTRSAACSSHSGVWLYLEGAAPPDTATPPPAGRAPTATAITAADPDPSVEGQPVTFEVRVTSPAGEPTGVVRVDDGTTSCAFALASGVGSCALAFPTSGGRTVAATYAGTDRFAPSSASEPHHVRAPGDPPLPPPPPVPAPTTTTITTDTPDPSGPGQAVTVVVVVHSGADAPSGEVRVAAIGDGEPCSAALNAQGEGSCSLVLTASGAHTLAAEYAGNSYLAPSLDTEPHEVTPSPPPTNRPPVAADDAYTTDHAVESTLVVGAPGVLGNDSDPEGGTLTAVLETGPRYASQFALNADGSFTYGLRGGVGADTFAYGASDGEASSAPATVIITIAGGADAP